MDGEGGGGRGGGKNRIEEERNIEIIIFERPSHGFKNCMKSPIRTFSLFCLGGDLGLHGFGGISAGEEEKNCRVFVLI